jgi:hypothetical protein
MSKLATGTAAVAIAVMMLHGQRTATSQPSALFPETSIWLVSMGPDPGGKSGTQLAPTPPSEHISWWTSAASASNKDDEAEYRQERRACESLAGDARNHCMEYAKLRYGRS